MLSFDNLTADESSSLTVLLTKHLPRHLSAKGWISPVKLGPALQTTKQSVSRWLTANEIPANRVNSLIALPGSTLTREKLLVFVDLGPADLDGVEKPLPRVDLG